MRHRIRIRPEQAKTVHLVAHAMYGYIGLRMKRDALELAYQSLTTPRVHPDVFHAALDTILTFEGRCKLDRYKRLIEAAHETLPRKGKRKSRALMLCYYTDLLNVDYKTAYAFVPRRFAGPLWLPDMVLSLDICLALNKREQAATIARRVKRALKSDLQPVALELLQNALTCFNKTQISETKNYDRPTRTNRD